MTLDPQERLARYEAQMTKYQRNIVRWERKIEDEERKLAALVERAAEVQAEMETTDV